MCVDGLYDIAQAAAVAGERLAYDRSLLLSLYSSGLSPRPDIVLRIRQLELWTVYAGYYELVVVYVSVDTTDVVVGRRIRHSPYLRDVGNGASIICSTRSVPSRPVAYRSSTALRRLHVDRHSSPSSCSIVCGCINIRSFTINKVDDLLEVRRDRSIDVLFVVET